MSTRIGKFQSGDTKSRASYLQKQQEDRRKRTFNILQSYDPIIANEVCYRDRGRSQKDYHIIVIQKWVRGFLARKRYTDLLYDQYLEEERREREIQNRRVQEGLAELETKRIEGDIKNRKYLQRQRELQKEYAATIIQRSYRRYLEKRGFAKLNRDASFYQGYTPRYFQTEESMGYQRSVSSVSSSKKKLRGGTESATPSTRVTTTSDQDASNPRLDDDDDRSSDEDSNSFEFTDHKFFITNDYIGNFNEKEYDFEDKNEDDDGVGNTGVTVTEETTRFGATGESNLSETFGSSIHSIRGFRGFLNESNPGGATNAGDDAYQRTFERVHYYKDLNLISPHSAAGNFQISKEQFLVFV